MRKSKRSEGARDGAERWRRGSFKRVSLLAFVSSLCCAVVSKNAFAADDSWISGSGNWTAVDNSDWSLGAPPGPGDNADIVDDDTTNRNIAYNYAGTSETLITLTVANLGAGTNQLTLANNNVILSVQNENVASVDARDPSNGQVFQTASYNYISGNLTIGEYQSDSALYALEGGTLAITGSNGSEFVGGDGDGTFENTGGVNSLIPGAGLQVAGAYSLTGSGQLSSNSEQVNVGGTFAHSGAGQNVMVDGGSLAISGTYSLIGTGVLDVPGTEYVGGGGTFVQAGATNDVSSFSTVSRDNGALEIGGGSGDLGTYVLSGGSLNVTGINEILGLEGTGTLLQTGGTNTVTGANLGLGSDFGSAGYYSLSASGSLNVSGRGELIGYYGTGTFVENGGINNISGDLEVSVANQSAGTYSLSGAGGTLTVEGNEYIGEESGSAGTFIQSGGTNTLTGTSSNFYVAYDGEAGFRSTGFYSLSASGNLISGDNEYIGYAGNGTFMQSGGTNTNFTSGGGDWLYIGFSGSGTGAYFLSGGSVLTSAMSVGYKGGGTFNQSGGTLTASSFINVADQSLSSGSYTLSNGSVSTPYLAMGAGSSSAGTFNQTGGTATVSDAVFIAAASGSTGVYSLSGTGALNVGGGVFVGGSSSGEGGSGTLTISAGKAAIQQTFEVWNSSDTSVTISGGVLSAGNTVNLATITQTAGTTLLGPITGAGSLSVGTSTGSTASMTATGLNQNSVTINATGFITLNGGNAKSVDLLTINRNGTLDLTNHHLFIDYGSGADPIASIRAYLFSGYSNGKWNGPQISSSSAAANRSYSLGYADYADAGNPANLSSGQIEVKYTLYGDVNLDGEVNGTDFGIMASNFGKSVVGWDKGDMDFSGSVNGTDFALLAANFGKTDSGTAVTLPAANWAALDAFAAAHGLLLDVPEPGSIEILAIVVGTALLTRRRRNS